MNKLEITPDKQQIAAGGNPSLRLFDIATGSATSYDGHTNNVTAIGFQKDGKWFFTGSEDGTIKIVRARVLSFYTSGCSRCPLPCAILMLNDVLQQIVTVSCCLLCAASGTCAHRGARENMRVGAPSTVLHCTLTRVSSFPATVMATFVFGTCGKMHAVLSWCLMAPRRSAV